MRRKLLPFYSERSAKPDMIVIHSQAFEIKKAIETFEHFKVSSHYLIEENGEIWQLVEEKTTPRNRDEQEIAGYRDVLEIIHENFDGIMLFLFRFAHIDELFMFRDGINAVGHDFSQKYVLIRVQPLFDYGHHIFAGYLNFSLLFHK